MSAQLAPALTASGRTFGAIAAVGLAWLVFIWAWEPAYLLLTVDDAYYYLVIATRAAHGEGLTFDGLQPTNGFHPLWLAVLVLFRAAASSATPTAMRLVLTAQVGMFVLGVALLSAALRPGRTARWVPIAAAGLMLNFYVAKILLNGQESALLFLLLCAAIAAAAAGRSALTIGLLAALSGLTRLDAAVFGLALAGGLTLTTPAARVRTALGMFAPQLALVGGYLAWNRVVFSHWLPISVAVKAGWAGLGPLAAVWVAATCVVSFAAAHRIARRFSASVSPGLLASLVGLLTYSAFLLAQARLRGGWSLEIWYLAPAAILAILALAALLSRATVGGLARPATAVLALAFSALTVGVWMRRLEPRSYEFYLQARELGRWLAQNTEEQTLVAGWDIGIVAAHSDRRVINLEGLVNSWSFKEEVLDRQAVDAFLDAAHVSVLVQPLRVDSLRGPGPLRYEATSIGAWHLAYSRCVHFSPALATGFGGDRVVVALDRDVNLPTLDQARATLCLGP